MFRKKCFMCKILYGVVQGFGKSLDKGTASGRTCFVELYAVYSLILDLDTFHILTTDIEDAVYGRIEECRRVVVGDRLDLALIQHEGRL